MTALRRANDRTRQTGLTSPLKFARPANAQSLDLVVWQSPVQEEIRCGANFIADFIAAASAKGIDFSCKDRIQLPSFALGAK